MGAPRRIVASAAACLAALPLLAVAFEEGALPGYTGGFGEQTCHKCHFDNALDDPGGSLELAGVPASYAPGGSYPLTIRLVRPAARRGGFQLSARFAEGDERAQQAGDLRPGGEDTQVVRSADGRVQYLSHTARGPRPDGEGVVSWTTIWMAPAAAHGPVVFHVAANAGNDDASPLGDYVYRKEVRSAAR